MDTSHITYLLSRTEPAGSLIHRSRYTLSRTRGPTKQVAGEISANVYSFNLNFPTHNIYIYYNRFLHLQTNRATVPRPVESESRIGETTRSRSPHDRTRTQLSLGVEHTPGWSVTVGIN